jgi:hypothetical protein
MMPRFLAKLYANLHGYFWLPCRVCGENFGGFEIGEEIWAITTGQGECVCAKPGCQEAARKHTDEVYAAAGMSIVRRSPGDNQP